MRAIEIPFGDSGFFCRLAEMMMQSLECAKIKLKHCQKNKHILFKQ